MHCRHTCIAAHTGQMHVVLWTCTHTCKSGDGMGTTLKWMLARARGQGDHTPLSASSCEHLFKGSAHPIPALAGMGTSPQHHMHLLSVCCNASVLQCKCAPSLSLLRESAIMFCCSQLQASDFVRWQPRRRGTGVPAPGGGARGGAAADSLCTAGRACCLWLLCVCAHRVS